MWEITLESVSKRFGAVKAVDAISFRAEKGKFVVLLGPSGCGKSTLLRLIAGLDEVSAGKIFIEGRDVTALDPTKRIRPEHIRLVTNGDGVAAFVESAEYHGADTIVSARVGEASLLVRAPGVERRRDASFRRGDGRTRLELPHPAILPAGMRRGQ